MTSGDFYTNPGPLPPAHDLYQTIERFLDPTHSFRKPEEENKFCTAGKQWVEQNTPPPSPEIMANFPPLIVDREGREPRNAYIVTASRSGVREDGEQPLGPEEPCVANVTFARLQSIGVDESPPTQEPEVVISHALTYRVFPDVNSLGQPEYNIEKDMLEAIMIDGIEDDQDFINLPPVEEPETIAVRNYLNMLVAQHPNITLGDITPDSFS